MSRALGLASRRQADRLIALMQRPSLIRFQAPRDDVRNMRARYAVHVTAISSSSQFFYASSDLASTGT